ncbi:unnamed protein product [Phytomonas sp. EM1]|nr:unnamed protein product [Phytomonas sp. EM1]|eukprot:CCW65557.1 unnamed protein product [Phytomonas sp. isolate EM1]
MCRGNGWHVAAARNQVKGMCNPSSFIIEDIPVLESPVWSSDEDEADNNRQPRSQGPDPKKGHNVFPPLHGRGGLNICPNDMVPAHLMFQGRRADPRTEAKRHSLVKVPLETGGKLTNNAGDPCTELPVISPHSTYPLGGGTSKVEPLIWFYNFINAGGSASPAIRVSPKPRQRWTNVQGDYADEPVLKCASDRGQPGNETNLGSVASIQEKSSKTREGPFWLNSPRNSDLSHRSTRDSSETGSIRLQKVASEDYYELGDLSSFFHYSTHPSKGPSWRSFGEGRRTRECVFGDRDTRGLGPHKTSSREDALSNRDRGTSGPQKKTGRERAFRDRASRVSGLQKTSGAPLSRETPHDRARRVLGPQKTSGREALRDPDGYSVVSRRVAKGVGPSPLPHAIPLPRRRPTTDHSDLSRYRYGFASEIYKRECDKRRNSIGEPLTSASRLGSKSYLMEKAENEGRRAGGRLYSVPSHSSDIGDGEYDLSGLNFTKRVASPPSALKSSSKVIPELRKSNFLQRKIAAIDKPSGILNEETYPKSDYLSFLW